MKEPKALFISYTGLLEPILSSQGIPYLKGLVGKGYGFVLLTYEKKSDLERVGRDGCDALKKELASQGIEWVALRYHKRPKVASTLFDLFIGMGCVSYLIVSRRIGLVHVRGVTPGAIMIFLPKALGAKVLFDMRGRLAEEMAAGGLWKTDSTPFRLVKMAEKRLLKTADAVTVLTHRHFEYNDRLDYFKTRAIPKEVIPCCVDMDRFNYNEEAIISLRKSLGLEGSFVLMYQGKLGTFYFMDRMLDFYKKASISMPNSVFVILTNDDPAPLIELARARGIGEEDLRIFRGLPFAEIPHYLQIADAGIFFINSHEKLGSSPIKMGEFLACGVPVVINPGVGDSDSIVAGENVGVIVEGYSAEAYDEAVKRLLVLIKDENSLRKRCREAATKYLSLENGIAGYYKIYRGLLPVP